MLCPLPPFACHKTYLFSEYSFWLELEEWPCWIRPQETMISISEQKFRESVRNKRRNKYTFSVKFSFLLLMIRDFLMLYYVGRYNMSSRIFRKPAFIPWELSVAHINILPEFESCWTSDANYGLRKKCNRLILSAVNTCIFLNIFFILLIICVATHSDSKVLCSTLCLACFSSVSLHNKDPSAWQVSTSHLWTSSLWAFGGLEASTCKSIKVSNWFLYTSVYWCQQTSWIL